MRLRGCVVKVIYIAGPMRAADGWEVNLNVHRAEVVAREVARMGAVPLTPHSVGAHMIGTETDEYWLDATLELMRRCDAVLVLPEALANDAGALYWILDDDFPFYSPLTYRSKGTYGEVVEAKRLNIPIIFPARPYKKNEPTVNLLRLQEWLSGTCRT